MDIFDALRNPHAEHMRVRGTPGATVFVQFTRALGRDVIDLTFDEAMREIHQNPTLQGHFGKVENTTWGRKDNDYPEWARLILEKNGFRWDSFNLCYRRKVRDTWAGEELMTWWVEQIVPWAIKRQLPLAEASQIQTTDETEELAGMETY